MEKDLYKNILVIVVGLLVVDWFFNVPHMHITVLVIGLLCIFISPVAKGLNWLWIKLALGLGWINSRILLSITYYLLLVPLAFMARIFKGNSINLRDINGSMYQDRNHEYTKNDLKDQW